MGEDKGEISAEDMEKYKIEASENNKNFNHYWKLALLNSKFFEINDKDEEVLDHLTNITIKFSEDTLDFTVYFHFEKNEFFDEEILSKSFEYDKSTYDPIKATATVPTWKEGKNPAIKIKAKKQKSKEKKIK